MAMWRAHGCARSPSLLRIDNFQGVPCAARFPVAGGAGRRIVAIFRLRLLCKFSRDFPLYFARPDRFSGVSLRDAGLLLQVNGDAGKKASPLRGLLFPRPSTIPTCFLRLLLLIYYI